MLKKIVSILVSLAFVVTMFPLIYTQDAYAYQNNSYFTGVKVGLVSMASLSMNVVTNGNYTVNGQAYPSGTSFSLGISGTSLTLNGTPQSLVSFIPDKSTSLLNIVSNSISNNYMGSFSFVLNKGKILPINSIDVESYLKGVVGYEMSDSFPIEALKAQTIAARNYALSRIGYESANGYDFDDTPSYQTYKGYNASYANSIAAVDQTKGQVLLYNNNLVETLYSAWHGGVSEDSENVWGNVVPYLRSVQDSYESDPWPNGNRTFTNLAIQTALRSKGYLASTDTFIKLDLASITRFPSGRVSNINIIYKNSAGTIMTKSVTKDSTRTFLTLPSNLYTVVYDSVNGIYTFNGKGNGHGLGMSQIGAKNRALAGQTYDQILKFYYQNVSLQNLIAKAAIGTFSLSANSTLTGSTVSMNTTANLGNGYGYLYKYVVKNGNNVVFSNDYSSNQKLDYTPTASGNYSATVYVKDKFSLSDYDDTQSQQFSVFDYPQLGSVTSDKNQLFINNHITINAQGKSGSGAYMYKFVVMKNNSACYTQDYSTSNTLDYVPASDGNYSVVTYIKDVLSTNPYDDMNTLNFTAYNTPSISLASSDNAVVLGKNVTYNASEVNGSGAATYRFVVNNASTIVSDSGFTTSGAFSFTPTTPGAFTINAYLKDSISSNAFDSQAANSLNVYSPKLTATTVTGSFYEGKPLALTTGSTGASPSGLSYKYELYSNNSLITATNFSTAGDFSFTPATSGSYTLKIYGKDGISSNAYDTIKQFDLSIISKPLYLSTTPLSYGMTSSDVTALQNSLIKLGYSLSSATGYFGSQTKNAVISFQTAHGLTADGIVGNMTYSAINDALILNSGNKTQSY